MSRHHRRKRQRKDNGGESDHAASGCDRRKDFSGWRGHYAENGKITPHDLSENADGFPDTDRFLDPRRTLGDGIGESLRNCGMSRHDADAQTARLLERCGLPASFAGRYPHEVSGGQCQRAAIARALAVKPKVLICDEATSALDVTVQKEILELLNELRCEQGTALSILFICHDISLVQQFCDRVLVMYHGDIVEQGAPDAVIYHPQNDYTKRLIDSVL